MSLYILQTYNSIMSDKFMSLYILNFPVNMYKMNFYFHLLLLVIIAGDLIDFLYFRPLNIVNFVVKLKPTNAIDYPQKINLVWRVWKRRNKRYWVEMVKTLVGWWWRQQKKLYFDTSENLFMDSTAQKRALKYRFKHSTSSRCRTQKRPRKCILFIDPKAYVMIFLHTQFFSRSLSLLS